MSGAHMQSDAQEVELAGIVQDAVEGLSNKAVPHTSCLENENVKGVHD